MWRCGTEACRDKTPATWLRHTEVCVTFPLSSVTKKLFVLPAHNICTDKCEAFVTVTLIQRHNNKVHNRKWHDEGGFTDSSPRKYLTSFLRRRVIVDVPDSLSSGALTTCRNARFYKSLHVNYPQLESEFSVITSCEGVACSSIQILQLVLLLLLLLCKVFV